MKYLKIINNIFTSILLITLLIYLNLGRVLVIDNVISYLEFSKIIYLFGIVSIILYLIYKVINKERLRLDDLLIILLGIFSIISYYFALNKDMALYGANGRYEGLFIVLTYYSLFLLSKTLNKKYQKTVMVVALLLGFIQIIIGTIQTMRITNILGYDRTYNWSTTFKFASGTFGNPNFYSTYILMCLMYVYGLFIKSKKNIYFNLLLLVIFIYGLILGNTSSCTITFILIASIVLIKKINSVKKLFSAFIVLILAVILIMFMDNYFNNRISFTMNKDIEEIKEILDNGVSDKTFNGRIYIWKMTMKKVPDYILTGIGIDSFSLINNGNYLCYTTTKYECFDKAHNEYLQRLITEGIFSLIIYLMLIGYIIYQYVKYQKYNNKEDYGLFLLIISYLIQAFFNISVIEVAPFMYISMGFLVKDN